MAGFIYNGHSTEDYLPDNTTVAFFDGLPEGYGLEREMQGGSPTLFRPIPNEYGTLDNPQEIVFTLLKCNGEIFTSQEQIKIETWLTAPRLSTPLYFVPNGRKSITGPTPYYYGIFTKTQWVPRGKGFLCVTLTFMPTTVYPFMKGVERISLAGRDGFKKVTIPKVNPDEFIYPKITIKDNHGNFSIQNTSIGDKVMSLTGTSSIDELFIDCKNCIIKDVGRDKLLSFSDIGWTTVDKIVWFRMRQGINELELNGNGSVTIAYEVAYKKVGGWFE